MIPSGRTISLKHKPNKEVDYDTAGRILNHYRDFCTKRGIGFHENTSVLSPDPSTLFCSAGMQHFKNDFRQSDQRTVANVQRCLRLVDLDHVGDGTHGLVFDMLGLFSFRQMELGETVDFWIDFLHELGLDPSHVTIHPDKPNWRDLHHGREIRFDPDCQWSDGDLGGYSTEFYRGEVEIGNIVNTMGTCIDVGFGLERLAVQLGDPPRTRVEELSHTIVTLINCGIKPDHKGAGYILKKIIRCLYRDGGSLDHLFFHQEKKRQDDLKRKFERLWDRNSDQPESWWLGTHGIVPGDYL